VTPLQSLVFGNLDPLRRQIRCPPGLSGTMHHHPRQVRARTVDPFTQIVRLPDPLTVKPTGSRSDNTTPSPHTGTPTLRALLETPDQLRVVTGQGAARTGLNRVFNKPLNLLARIAEFHLPGPKPADLALKPETRRSRGSDSGRERETAPKVSSARVLGPSGCQGDGTMWGVL
jgi:hypothetical protein